MIKFDHDKSNLFDACGIGGDGIRLVSEGLTMFQHGLLKCNSSSEAIEYVYNTMHKGDAEKLIVAMGFVAEFIAGRARLDGSLKKLLKKSLTLEDIDVLGAEEIRDVIENHDCASCDDADGCNIKDVIARLKTKYSSSEVSH